MELAALPFNNMFVPPGGVPGNMYGYMSLPPPPPPPPPSVPPLPPSAPPNNNNATDATLTPPANATARAPAMPAVQNFPPLPFVDFSKPPPKTPAVSTTGTKRKALSPFEVVPCKTAKNGSPIGRCDGCNQREIRSNEILPKLHQVRKEKAELRAKLDKRLEAFQKRKQLTLTLISPDKQNAVETYIDEGVNTASRQKVIIFEIPGGGNRDMDISDLILKSKKPNDVSYQLLGVIPSGSRNDQMRNYLEETAPKASTSSNQTAFQPMFHPSVPPPPSVTYAATSFVQANALASTSAVTPVQRPPLPPTVPKTNYQYGYYPNNGSQYYSAYQ